MDRDDPATLIVGAAVGLLVIVLLIALLMGGRL